MFFDAEGDLSNSKRIHDFSGFGFQTDNTDFKNKVAHIQGEFSLNFLIIPFNLLSIS